MDQSNDTSLAALRGHNFGDTSIDGNATVIQGDVHINNQSLSQNDKREQQVGALYTALSYDGMHLRSEQISLPQIPLQSFAWIWETQLHSWLASEAPLFWITGKPGSGKSTLMQHLTKSHRTYKILNSGNRHYTVLSFFFDYRAGNMTANDSVGVLKMFLSQLCKCDQRLERRLAESNAKASIDKATFSVLLDLFAEMSRLLRNEMCAFVDGLDEFYGHYTELGEILAQIQDRTGIRLCVASRPELAFQGLFDSHPSIRMQDYNAASVRAYIDSAISKGRENVAQVDVVFNDVMREQLQRRAQGVIIWARLAVDELLRAAYLDTSEEMLEDILEQLPDELEAMYERSISRRRHSNTMEVALILFLLNEFGGSLVIDVLFGMWHFVSSRIREQSIPIQSVTDPAAFVHRMRTLVGTLLDILSQSNEVRLMHKTLQPYLRRSIWIRNQLPRDFTNRYPDNLELRVYADVIETATNAGIVLFDKVLQLSKPAYDQRTNLHPSFYYSFMPIGARSIWKIRLVFLAYSVGHFLDWVSALEERGISPFEICRNAMSSCLLITDLRVLHGFSVWSRAHRRGFLDLVIAIDRTFHRYVNDRLTGELLLDDRDWSELLCKAASDPNMLDLLRPYCKTIHSDFLSKCWSIRLQHGQSLRSEYLASVLSEMRLAPSIRRDSVVWQNDICGKGDDLIHWWTRNCAADRLSGTILRLIVNSGESVNTRCKQAGTALHILIDQCLNQHITTTQRIEGKLVQIQYDHIEARFATLAKLGIDPTIEHTGRTPLQVVQKAERKPVLGNLFAPVKPSYTQYYPALTFIGQALKHYDDEKRWPAWVLAAGEIPG